MKKLLLFLLFPLTLFGQSQKISDMTSATSLTGSEYVPIVQTTNKKSTVTLLRGWASTIGTAGQLLKVNAGATALEFFTPTYLSGVVSIANGGTGLSALGTANQLLRVNAGATGLEYFTPSFLSDTTAFIKTQGTSLLTDDITIDYSGVTQYARIYMDSSQINIEQVDTLSDSRSILSFNSYGLNFSTSDIAFTGAGALFTQKDSAAVVYTDNGTGLTNGIVAKRDSTNVYGPVYLKKSLTRNDTLNQILARDFTTGRLKYVSKNALTGSSWPLTGSATLTGNVDIDASASNYNITLGSTNMIGALGINAMTWSIGDYTNAVGGAAITGGGSGMLLRDYSSTGIQMNVGGALFYFDPTGDISIATRYLGAESLLSKATNQLTLNGTGINNSVIINAASPATTDRTWTIPDLSGDQTFVGLTGTQTLSGKTIALGSNTVSGSLAEFNTALTGADFATGGGTATGTNSGDQSLANTSDATSHTVTLTGGTSVQLIEGSNITLTTGGTGGAGTVTIASTGGGSSAFDDLTAAAATNSIDNTNYLQTWNWSTLASTYGLSLLSNSTTASGDAQGLLSVQLTGANSNAGQISVAGRFINNHTGTGSENYALALNASSGDTNYALWVDEGNIKLDAGVNFELDATTGTKFGTATTQKIGFYNATPVVRQNAVTTVQELADALTAYGLLPSSTVSGGSGLTYAQVKAMKFK